MDLTKIAELANPVITTLLGSSGIWMWAKTRFDRNNSEGQLLLEVTKNQLTVLGRSYLERGYITMDEYEEYEAEYKLYSALGGNGLAKRVFKQVDELPMMPSGINGRNI